MKGVLITRITDQGGAYLVELLFSKRHEVHGIKLRLSFLDIFFISCAGNGTGRFGRSKRMSSFVRTTALRRLIIMNE